MPTAASAALPAPPIIPHFCFDHPRKESRARSANKLARELSYFFSGDYLSANDLSAALGCRIATKDLSYFR